ncbi:MAG: hypothetical protein IJP69_07710 [Synergistaceae bacterium]|nr:hypothetical protein [Synergistaceae bacterium]
MLNKRRFIFPVVLMMIAAFFAVSIYGCGGSSSSSDSGNPVPEEKSATRPETIINLDSVSSVIGMDADNNGKPDFLDFSGVSQIHVKNSVSNSSFRASTAPSILAAAEMNVNVPSMMWLNRLRSESEGGNTFLVPLVGGQEYTFELSINLTEDLGGVLPNISFYDPSNSLLSLDVAEEMQNVTTVAYPKECPSIICYTIKPEVSGNYIVKVTNGEPYSGAYLTDNNEIAHFTPEYQPGSVLFIYKERRNEKGETGYYTNFKFQDENGNKTESVSIENIIQLRKLFCEANPTYFEKVYGQDMPDDEEGDDNISYQILGNDENSYYAHFLARVLSEIGVVDVILDPYEYMSDAELDAICSDDNYKIPESTISRKIVSSGSAISTSALADEPAAIESEITGIPYESRYQIGRGSMAYTFLDPPGGVRINIKDAYKKYCEQMDTVSGDKHPKDSDTNASNPVATDFYAKFVNTASQSESLTKTSANVSLATSALGISAGTGSTSNFKFGLTSTTLVIHYEETEIDYRELSTEELHNAWTKSDFLNMVREDYPDKPGGNFLEEFRNDFGDYYVSGYQYGACFDAYIAITTQTSEQLKEVESKLSANLSLSSVSASADVSNKTKDTLKENKATVNIRVVTSGMGHAQPTELKLTNSSKDIAAMDDVFDQLLKFRSKLGANVKRSQYAPVRVKMTRWRSDPRVARIMRKKGDRSGKIPLTIGQAETISAFNTDLRDLRAYRNVVMDNSAINGTYTSPIEEKFNGIITRVTAAGDRLYNKDYKASFDQTVKEVDELSKKFKALGDRYTFYTKLVIAQKQEKETYDRLKTAADGAGEGTATAYANVRKMPFGVDHGGSSGYDKYGVSEYVTADINAGKKDYKAVHVSRPSSSAWRIEWTHHDTQTDQYLVNEKPAKLTASTTDNATAVFCWVRVRSSNADSKDDRARELVNGSPAVGTNEINFYFKSGYSSSIDWEIEGKAMRMRVEDYPFVGLQ